ncbi:hypothetical protein EV183_005062 [Coemansia sp. RSA 2336]|nr:hypothetical protein EV183_005062 [Coemansia sp. RSA 2336]
MSDIKSGRVKFFNSQKGYGFVIPSEPIDGHSEVFVHHSVIYNSGGFKSLAEGEPVEFEVIRGPKGIQATRVTGPNGTFVRGDPYARLRSRMPYGGSVNAGMTSSIPAAPYIQYSGYPQVMPYVGQVPQPQFSSFGYSASPPPHAMPTGDASAPGDNGRMPKPIGGPNGAPSIPPQRYYGVVMPIPQKNVPLSEMHSSFMRQPSQVYDFPATFSYPSANGSTGSSAPNFSISSHSNTGSS